ncbi:TolC family protein [Jeongeupia naejangsanensis]|uniref:TolC family protein n=1 Tax=Jeongeupia naejangsanensis TaxID=613195 RepID=A0ABS2BJ68_9NEIS|nr:TolC family protein [Jeongeupia naejangsanensis]MBM3115480.1 TolC family protein [Jeongeupia naejangsanensis]
MSPFLFLAAAFGAASLGAHALTLDEALAAAGGAPDLVASTAATTAAQSLTKSAGALPDPKLSVWVDDLQTSGPDAYRVGDAKRMVSLMQEVPNGDRRDAERQVAGAQLQTSEAQARYTQLSVRRETTLAWLALHYLDRKLDVLAAQDADNRHSQQAGVAALKGGASADAALAARLERDQLDDSRDDIERDRAKARAQLARWIGPALAAQPATGGLPAWLTTGRAQADDIAEQPEIRAAATQVSAAQAELALARAAKKPDWGVEVGWGYDAMDQGMAMVKFTFDLPVFAASRQDPKIAAALANVQKSDAERQARMAAYRQQIDELRAERTAILAQVDRLKTRTLPLIDQQVELALAGMKSGKGSDGVLGARKARLAAQMRAIELESQLAAADTRLYFLTGAH